MAAISGLAYVLDLKPQIKWLPSQETNLNRSFPFTDLNSETPDQFVVRTYLQFLWLPESIMPLSLLVPSMKRVQVVSTSADALSSPHPLYALLDPILLTARASANKYHVELPEILNNDGGAGEIEETMMWFALSQVKSNVEDQAEREQTRSNGSENGAHSSHIIETPIWMNNDWRLRWIRRMERREAQIQILLYFLILSLPGPQPSHLESPEMSSVKRRKRPRKKTAPVATPEDRLEAFMDKLSMWQLMGDLDSNEVVRITTKERNELDWAQLFCQNTIEPSFKLSLPESCALFRSKVFPNSPFSDEEDEHFEETQRVSDDSSDGLIRAFNPPTRHPSPALSVTSTASNRQLKRAPSQQDFQRSRLQRERSRSLSLSLAEEAEEKQKAKHIGLGSNKGRVLSREVSMSFKSKNKAPTATTAATASFWLSESHPHEQDKPTKHEPSVTVLVESTPSKPVRTVLMSQVQIADSATILVEATPVKSVWTSQSHSTSQTGLFSRASSLLGSVGEEEIWNPPESSSPDILMLTPGKGARADESFINDDAEWTVSTPTKARKRQRIEP